MRVKTCLLYTSKERVIHSPAAGNMKNICQIADLVEKDQVIAMVGDTPVKATISGVIRGLIRDGYQMCIRDRFKTVMTPT